MSVFFKKRFFLVCTALLLASCSGDSWFGEEQSLALTGKRLSVLNYGADLTPDPEALKKAIILPSPEPTPSWPQAGGLSHHAMQNPALGEKIIEAWQERVGKPNTSNDQLIAEPVGQNGVIYTIDSRAFVQAFSVKNGKPLWQKLVLDSSKSQGISILGSGLALSEESLFVATGIGDLIALNAKNGQELWRTKLNTPIRSAPTVYGGRLFVLTADNKLIALAQDDGRVLWQHYAFLESISLLGKASPAIDNGIGVAVFASGEVLAFRPENGSILWTEALGSTKTNDVGSAINDIKARPVIDGDTVYIITSGGLLSALDLKTGASLWEREIHGVNQPWIAGETLYVVSTQGQLVALEAQTGKVLWINSLKTYTNEQDKSGRLFWTGPVLAGNRLILTNSAGQAIAVSPQTGVIIGWDQIDTTSTLSPIVLNETLFFLTHNANLVAYRS